MDNDLEFRKYKAVSDQIDILLKEKEFIRESITNRFKEQGIGSLETAYGKFSLATRTSYTYTDKVTALEEKVKLAKVKEEQKGIATPKETQYLRFTQIEV